ANASFSVQRIQGRIRKFVQSNRLHCLPFSFHNRQCTSCTRPYQFRRSAVFQSSTCDTEFTCTGAHVHVDGSCHRLARPAGQQSQPSNFQRSCGRPGRCRNGAHSHRKHGQLLCTAPTQFVAH